MLLTHQCNIGSTHDFTIRNQVFHITLWLFYIAYKFVILVTISKLQHLKISHWQHIYYHITNVIFYILINIWMFNHLVILCHLKHYLAEGPTGILREPEVPGLQGNLCECRWLDFGSCSTGWKLPGPLRCLRGEVCKVELTLKVSGPGDKKGGQWPRPLNTNLQGRMLQVGTAQTQWKTLERIQGVLKP